MTHRVAVLDKELCQPKKCGLECIKYCPVNKSGADCITLNDEIKKAQIDENLCNGCGICVKVCPFDAITIVNLASELSADKVHQYGMNSFRLYKLPTPKKGSVVGLLGRNGMGKSTVINILSGNLKPNLGNFQDPPDWDDILKYYSGTELKSHFEDIRDDKIRASIKPQQVHQIAEAFNGNGKELIEKYDEREVSSQLIKDLGLENAINHNLRELSGGELQRIAVATAAAKDAEFYFFDEPSSYNDVFQRASVAKTIHSLSALGKSVMVVEHDLTFLDYLSDFIEVLYGEPSAYGIVSNVLATKVGINVFLDGYLPGENVRFRDKQFTFEATSSSEEFLDETKIITYPRLEKKIDNFSVSIEAGEVRKGEILGIMGANALGKTTMMKMIAGVEKPDSGKIDKKVKISYKPQYLKNDADIEVIKMLDKANDKPIEGSTEEEQIIEPLKIKKLYNKSLNHLSGGELQKVAVASCLLQKVDLFALDEPSAFLDVEDRIAIAKFLQKFVRSYGKSAIVIDHDLQLMDLISDRVVIFEGTSGIEGKASTPMKKSEAMNRFLKSLSITFRRDEKSLRPRVNKIDSRLDKEQKTVGNFYYKN
ncbi:MAG: ribosome biogenesis/translation initiation ATPase RLI [Nitrosopumilaceae archaeon]|nr:ribosome biogenesis/translation initiation ATPase RLI [Nitrosopumilaceae archaeon]NIU00474.1 ribosome biogenesis/translation initiation ATPase RLI [Nitrosopumilaceae archaeon]NIU86857.1 ribosome biogenesis/translation initiation ATPase RLI [Nitrosopumilaceae archaeon]NIV65538.1 ribosome biogenesis/translation initiation ATPase RLI [Nitrosopumilaceae archaeon]NIX61076.1 ribosome biogenesis/translation initiation ATPase RLI [Nitrosopumilaceae archaeon]